MQEVFEYGIFSFFFSTLPLLVVILLSIPLGMVFEGFLMIIPFILLRKFTGGFHFSTPLPCILTSVALLIFNLVGIYVTIYYKTYSIISTLVVLSLIPIIVYSPIDSQNRKLSEIEKKLFRKIAITLSLIVTFIYSVFLFSSCYHIAIPIGFGIILTAFLQVPCFFKKDHS